LVVVLELRAEAQVKEVLVGVPGARSSIVREHVLVVGPVDAYTNHRVAVVSEGAHTRQFARYLKCAHRVACLEEVAAVEAERGQLELTIELLVLQVEDVHGALVAARA
jgi:hypothetical protein